MTLSQTTVLAQIRDLVAAVTGMEAVYSPSETDINSIPNALNEFPCALVLPGPTIEYIIMSGGQRHTYDVHIQVFESGADLGERTASVLPFVDRIISKFEANVGLGGRANSCIFDKSSGLSTLTYGGKDYAGYDITLRVSEQASAAPAIGS